MPTKQSINPGSFKEKENKELESATNNRNSETTENNDVQTEEINSIEVLKII